MTYKGFKTNTFLLVCVMGILSCDHTENLIPETGKGSPVKFGSPQLVASSTKSLGEMTTDNITDTEIRVYGDLFDDGEAKLSFNSSFWEADKLAFWDGENHDWAAVAPYSAATDMDEVGRLGISGIPVVSHTENGTDYIAAAVAAQKEGTVNFSFSHLLSKLSVWVYTDNLDNETTEGRYLQIQQMTLLMPRHSLTATYRQAQSGQISEDSDAWTWDETFHSASPDAGEDELGEDYEAYPLANTLPIRPPYATDLFAATTRAKALDNSFFLAPFPTDGSPIQLFLKVVYQSVGDGTDPLDAFVPIKDVEVAAQGKETRLYVKVAMPEEQQEITFGEIKTEVWTTE